MKGLRNKLAFYTIIKRLELTVNHNIVVTKGPLKYNESMTSNEILPLRNSIFSRGAFALETSGVMAANIAAVRGSSLFSSP